MEEVNQIHSVELAEVMAYAEKPYQDQATFGEKSNFEKQRLYDLANSAGIIAAKKYVESQASIDYFDDALTAEALSEAEAELQARLDTSVEDLPIEAYAKGPNVHAQTVNILGREGNIRTLRDILVYGKHGIKKLPGMGTKCFSALDKAVAERLDSPDSEQFWVEKPEVGDIAKFCKNLGQVPAFMIACAHGLYNKKMPSIQDLLDTPEEELAVLVSNQGKWEGGTYIPTPNHARAAIAKHEAVKFAISFKKLQSAE